MGTRLEKGHHLQDLKAGGDTADKHYLNSAKTKSTADLNSVVDAAVKKEGRQTIGELAAATGACKGTVYKILT